MFTAHVHPHVGMYVFVVDVGASGILVEPVQLQREARGSAYTSSGEEGFQLQ